MPKSSLTPTNPDDFEKHIALLCKEQLHYDILMPPANTKGYDIEIRKGSERIAVQVKNQNARCSVAQVQRFLYYLDEGGGRDKFTSGWFISASGFGKAALALVEAEKPDNLKLGTYNGDWKIVWNYPDAESGPGPGPYPERALKYLGVFTSRGGVGKTTVAAHLAGAFALMGHDVILLDLDPDQNLRKLFSQDLAGEDATLFVPPTNKKGEGATITVLSHDRWSEKDYPKVKIVICDCSPVLTQNPPSLVEKFDYSIIPTTLTPLGVAKNAVVITRTFSQIREVNKKTEMFAVLNGYDGATDLDKKNEVLLSHLQNHLAAYIRSDAKCKFIHPDAAKIRYSRSLLYWGYHIVEGTRPQLAFKEIGGKSYPRTDFLQLAEYLEGHTDIDELLREEPGHAMLDRIGQAAAD